MVTVSVPQASRRRPIGVALDVVSATCIVASLVLGSALGIPNQYVQRISVIYVIPFLAILALLMIRIGATILFAEKWDALNLVLPIGGHGVLTGFSGYD